MNNLVINSVLHDNGNTTQPIKTCLPDSLIAHQKKHSNAENKEKKDSSKCDLKIPEPVKRRPSRRNKRFWQKLEEELKKDSMISRYPKVHPACIYNIEDIWSYKRQFYYSKNIDRNKLFFNEIQFDRVE